MTIQELIKRLVIMPQDMIVTVLINKVAYPLENVIQYNTKIDTKVLLIANIKTTGLLQNF